MAIDLALSGIAPVKSILSSTKTLTTPDTSQGIIKALESVIGDLSPERKDEIVAVNVGTTVSPVAPLETTTIPTLMLRHGLHSIFLML